MIDTLGTLQMPPQASTIAPQVDALYYFIFWGSVFFFTLIVGLSIIFIIRYRRRDGDDVRLPKAHHNTLLEVTWSVIPLLLVLVVFVWGFRGYMAMAVAPGDAIEYHVTGKRWLWQITHPNGEVAINEMTVPLGRPVKVILQSEDVLHSFFIPAFRVKMDAIPNRYTTLWFEATIPGSYDMFCTEYCGTGHSTMLAKVNVLPSGEYDAWLEETGAARYNTMDPVAVGEEVYRQKACVTCHSVDGTKKTCPTFQGIWGTMEQLTDGSQVLVDENYIRQSILEPGAQIVAGYENVMPTYAGTLKPIEIDGVIAYIKSLK